MLPLFPTPLRTLSNRAKLTWIGGLVAVDQATKYLAVLHIRDRPVQTFWNDFFRLEYAENPGAFLSLGARLSADTRFWVFAVAVGAFLFIASWVLFRDKQLDRWSAFALSVIVGGGTGNLIDRATRDNHGVVDFLNMGIGDLRTGIFNVADMAIMLGVGILLVKSLARTEIAPAPAKPRI